MISPTLQASSYLPFLDSVLLLMLCVTLFWAAFRCAGRSREIEEENWGNGLTHVKIMTDSKHWSKTLLFPREWWGQTYERSKQVNTPVIHTSLHTLSKWKRNFPRTYGLRWWKLNKAFPRCQWVYDTIGVLQMPIARPGEQASDDQVPLLLHLLGFCCSLQFCIPWYEGLNLDISRTREKRYFFLS